MIHLFRLAAERDALIKESMPLLSAAAAIGKMALPAAKTIVKNPITSAGVGLTGLDLATSAAKASGDTARARMGAAASGGRVVGGGTF